MVEINIERYEQAEEKENVGEFNQASELYLRSAFERLASTGFGTGPTGSNTLLAVGDSLRGIHCAIRADNRQKAEAIQTIVQGVLELLQNQTSNRCLKGLLIEWVGDSYLFVNDQNCKTYYKKAERIYKDVDDEEQRSWGMEPEVDHAYWVFESFVDWRGLEHSSTTDTPMQLDFCARIDFKLKVYGKLRFR